MNENFIITDQGNQIESCWYEIFHLLIETRKATGFASLWVKYHEILIFWTIFAQKGYYLYKTEKLNTTIEFCIFKLFLAPNFSLNWKFWFFGPHLTKKGISNHKQKSEHHHWILHIWISLSTKFQVKLTVLIFWNKFALKGYFQSKTEEVNITIEFCIFGLA